MVLFFIPSTTTESRSDCSTRVPHRTVSVKTRLVIAVSQQNSFMLHGMLRMRVLVEQCLEGSLVWCAVYTHRGGGSEVGLTEVIRCGLAAHLRPRRMALPCAHACSCKTVLELVKCTFSANQIPRPHTAR